LRGAHILNWYDTSDPFVIQRPDGIRPDEGERILPDLARWYRLHDTGSRNGGHAVCLDRAENIEIESKQKMAESARTPPFLPERYYLRTKVVRTATASKRPSIGPIARVAMSLRA
jgi:hypothetical protein